MALTPQRHCPNFTLPRLNPNGRTFASPDTHRLRRPSGTLNGGFCTPSLCCYLILRIVPSSHVRPGTLDFITSAAVVIEFVAPGIAVLPPPPPPSKDPCAAVAGKFPSPLLPVRYQRLLSGQGRGPGPIRRLIRPLILHCSVPSPHRRGPFSPAAPVDHPRHRLALGLLQRPFFARQQVKAIDPPSPRPAGGFPAAG